MGNTTILEINHDRGDEIARNRAAFVDAILQQIQSGRVRDIPGGTVIVMFPRWDQPIDKAWQRWKRKWRVYQPDG